jgi:fucose permease
MVAQINPERPSAALNWLNFCWSAGAVSCPFLVAAAAKTQRIPLLLAVVAASALALALYFTLASFVEPPTLKHVGTSLSALIRSRRLVFWLLAALFFLYVGTENGFGFWVASFAKSLGDMSAPVALLTPSFFYAALTLGRLFAPFFLRNISEIRLAQTGLVFACLGMAGMIISRQLPGVVLSASAAGLGLSSVYPITISILSRVFGGASSKIGSIMFVLSNFGGGLFPWIVGLTSNGFGTLKAGLLVPLIGCAVMYVLYLQKTTASQEQCTPQ